MNNYIIDAFIPPDSQLLPPDALFVYRECSKCGQKISQIEFAGCAFVADSCPKCGIPFVSAEEHKNHAMIKVELYKIFEPVRRNK